MQRLPRGVYTQEFREQAVRLVVEEKLSIPQASQRLSMSPKTLANGVGAARRGELAMLGSRQKPLTEGEEELRRLRRELAEMTMGEYSPKDRQKGVLVAVEQVRGREGDPELDGIVDHLCLFRDDLGAAGHASEVMAGVAVIVLNGDRSGFADDMPLRRQMLGESIPAVGVEDTVGQVLDLVVEPSKRCSITTADHPGNRSPCATIHRLDDPEFVFFEPMKCHISSNSISLISPGTSGSGSFAIASTLHR